MPAVKIVPQLRAEAGICSDGLPHLLRTPAGLAIIEIQGTINAPLPGIPNDGDGMQVGRLEFPLYKKEDNDMAEGSWMKKVYLYIGKHQRLNGEIRKLPKPLAVLVRDTSKDPASAIQMNGASLQPHREQLQMIATVKYKIMFASRPEPVGS